MPREFVVTIRETIKKTLLRVESLTAMHFCPSMATVFMCQDTGTVNAKNKPVSSQKRVQKPSSVIQSLELYGNELNDSGDFLWRLVVVLGLKQQID